jgi:hypothetical protein
MGKGKKIGPPVAELPDVGGQDLNSGDPAHGTTRFELLSTPRRLAHLLQSSLTWAGRISITLIQTMAL